MNEYLLDTHIFLWWIFGDSKLDYQTRDIIKRPENRLYLSAASAWEIATKHKTGKLPEAGPIVDQLPRYLRESRIDSLDITLADSLLAGSMNIDHRDSFDRMILAQAQLRSLPVLTNDQVLLRHLSHHRTKT